MFADFAFAREHVTPEPPSPVKVYTRGGATADTRHQASNHQCIMRTPIAMPMAHGHATHPRTAHCLSFGELRTCAAELQCPPHIHHPISFLAVRLKRMRWGVLSMRIFQLLDTRISMRSLCELSSLQSPPGLLAPLSN